MDRYVDWEVNTTYVVEYMHECLGSDWKKESIILWGKGLACFTFWFWR